MNIASSSFHPTRLRPCVLAAVTFLAVGAHAQDAGPPARAGAAPQTIVITGSATGQSESAPTSVLTGDELERRRGASIAETLANLPGVSSTYFGPNANRPTIRGQDGERVRVLANGGASADASTLSFDHAVPLDPLVVERLEVLRGPAALLYGGAAIGGVVNVIDNRIPAARIDAFNAATSLRFGGAADERAGSALLEAGGDGFAWHVDAFAREQSDLRVPAFDLEGVDGTARRVTRLPNSSSRADGGAVGVSRVWSDGHAGVSLDTYRSGYGSIADEAVRIQMKRERVAAKVDSRVAFGPIAQLTAQAASTRYAHDELEDGAVGTRFRNRAHDARVEAQHRPIVLGAWGELRGTWGVQAERGDFSALGDEAFVPPSRTRQAALFALESWAPTKDTALRLGLRGERVQVASSGDAADAAEPRFGAPVTRRFAPKSASLGLEQRLRASWQGLANVSTTQRAPAAHELYANGVHVATGAFERGDVAQRIERARHVELGLQGRLVDAAKLKLNAFSTRYANYIALAPTGEQVDELGEGGQPAMVPVYAYRGVPARLDGLEFEAAWPLTLAGGGAIELAFKADTVRGRNTATGEPLPRVAPARATLSADWQHGPTLVRVEVQHAARQARVPAFDTPTPAWTQWHLLASHRWSLGAAGDVLGYVKLGNATNALAFNAATLGSVRARAPLPGRSLAVGGSWQFR